eukprot:CAMPEP_0172566068 /NCGR_PEP_ID=MMETSP1067-20121228/110493_1 /TAXON_ID=265564 ORGANISM="Thalassiosira punctigera, Strain Tpunct2005C2" /NCGR_SAMPLE_ID=MMETSP1067 /ASSEMBLY_ACC=CAM_ASM_000444 /LENGTH=160 /DNA_ID=CAMNT_0013357091 /DNA_START=84 /DNA_END=562 /DNA_ORIENTATION=+
MPESRDVANYVATSLDREYPEKEKEALWKRGMNKMYSAWVEVRELVEWMRGYNREEMQKSIRTRRNHDPQEMVSYCGLDIGGFYSDWTHPMSKIQSYIKGQFPAFEAEWSREIEPILEIMGNIQARHNYQHVLTSNQKSTLAMLLDKLVTDLSSHIDELG